MATQQEIDSFAVYATQRLQSGSETLSVQELFDLWLAEQQPAEEVANGVVAVQLALEDMENGDAGRPFEEFSAEMRNQYGIGGR